jgi:hypothetical protein
MGIGSTCTKVVKNLTITLEYVVYEEDGDKMKPDLEQSHHLNNLHTMHSKARLEFVAHCDIDHLTWIDSMCGMQPVLNSRDLTLEQSVVFSSHFFSPARQLLAAGHKINVEMAFSLYQVNLTKSYLSRAVWYRYASHMLETTCT